MKMNLLNRLMPDLELITRRFPVSVLVCAVMFVFVSLEIPRLIEIDRQTIQRIYQAGFAAFLASGGMHLLAQGRAWSFARNVAASFGAAIVVAALLFFPNVFSVDPLMMFSALILWVMIAGFLRPSVNFNTVWLFNSRLAMAIALAVLVGSLFAGGISAILASLKYLFHISVTNNAYEHVISLGVIIVGPLYGLALLPHNIDEELELPRGDDLLNRGVSILINYVLVPVLLVYVLILHAYAIKIGFSFELPKGKVGIMVLIFGIAGTATWMIARPWVQTGTRFLQLFTRHWFWLTIVPMVLLIIAVFVRVQEYGVTPERYGLILVALWLAMMVGYFASKRLDAKPQVIIGSMAALLVLASFGPWGANGLSVRSQHQRLVVLLEKWGYVESGKIAAQLPNKNDVPTKEKISARSIVHFLRKQDQLDRLKPLFDGHSDNPFKSDKIRRYAIAAKINNLFGFERLVAARKAGQDFVSYRRKTTNGVPIAKNSVLIGPFMINRRSEIEFGNKGVIRIKDEIFSVTIESNQWQITVKSILEQAKTATESNHNNLVLELVGDGKPLKAIVNHLTGKLETPETSIRYMNFWMLLPAKANTNSQTAQ